MWPTIIQLWLLRLDSLNDTLANSLMLFSDFIDRVLKSLGLNPILDHPLM